MKEVDGGEGEVDGGEGDMDGGGGGEWWRGR